MQISQASMKPGISGSRRLKLIRPDFCPLKWQPAHRSFRKLKYKDLQDCPAAGFVAILSVLHLRLKSLSTVSPSERELNQVLHVADTAKRAYGSISRYPSTKERISGGRVWKEGLSGAQNFASVSESSLSFLLRLLDSLGVSMILLRVLVARSVYLESRRKPVRLQE